MKDAGCRQTAAQEGSDLLPGTHIGRRGRLQHPDIGVCARRQILLSRHHHITVLIVRGLHERFCLHSGTDYVLAKLQEEYWIPRARTVVKGVVRRCKTCIRLSARPSAPRMSDLPLLLVSRSVVGHLRLLWSTVLVRF